MLAQMSTSEKEGIPWLAGTFVNFGLAFGPTVALLTNAKVAVDFIETNTTILAWIRCTLVNQCLAVHAAESGIAYACVAIDLIDAFDRSRLHTWHACAFIDLGLAVETRISRRAGTRVTIENRSAGTAACTWLTGAFIDGGLTCRTAVSSNAGAFPAIDEIETSTAVNARMTRAFIDIGLTENPRIPRCTCARVHA